MGELSYGEYLNLDQILSAQRSLSGEHDELLFIVIHQASELWMKLSLHELSAACAHIAAEDLGPAFKMISRVARIQAQMIQSWDVLATMTPSEYHRIRPWLGRSSGFQSVQYRLLEFLMGAKDADVLAAYETDPIARQTLAEALAAPSLYDQANALLSRRGFAIPSTYLERDRCVAYPPNAAVAAAWLAVYRDPERHWDLYELAEKLVDLEYRFSQWRFSHLKTVERIIGFKRGTGGSGGVRYLASALDASFFPELMQVRTHL